jgi:hypothetical protein
MRIAAFGSREELAEMVNSPESFIKNRAQLTIVMSDQIPYYVKIQPGKQLYAEWERQSGKKDKNSSLSHLGGAGQFSQRTSHSIGGEDVEEPQVEKTTDGMTQKRGEATENNDKYRLTIDTEQVLEHWFDENQTPKAGWGTVSVTLVGAHMRFSNVSEDDRWIDDEQFIYNGVETKRVAGEKVPANLGKAIRDLKRLKPEFWQRLQDAQIEIYQQPAGFEDGIITAWKIQKQGKKYVCSVGLRDMFGGGLAETSRLSMCAINQLATWIWGKLTPVLQVTDTDVAMRMKATTRSAHDRLRVELMRLAEGEDTRAIFRCGFYEMLRIIVETVEELVAKMAPGQDILAAIRRNGWGALRPSLSKGTFVRADEQEWCKAFPEGNNRMKRSWLDKRYSWMDEKGLPIAPQLGEEAQLSLENQEEQSYHGEEGCKTSLATWAQLLKEGEVNEDDVEQWQLEPWFEMVVTDLREMSGLEEYQKLMMTPIELRKSLGIDENLTSQKPKGVKKKQKSREKYREAIRPMRKKAMSEMRELLDMGYSRKQVAEAIIPASGKKTNRAAVKDRLKMHFASKVYKAAKLKRMEAAKAQVGAEGGDEEAEVVEDVDTTAQWNTHI